MLGARDPRHGCSSLLRNNLSQVEGGRHKGIPWPSYHEWRVAVEGYARYP
jgi:hypothetical protein